MTFNPEAQQYADIDLDCNPDTLDFDLPWRSEGINIIDDTDNVICHVCRDEYSSLIATAPELLEALENLQKELHANIKLNVKKHFGLLVADAQASKAIYKARGGV